jgi:hypothetical protein
MRSLRPVFLATVLTATGIPAFAEDPHTTRIETRPYYGAVVTIEHGVRVFRPVPPTTHLIVNPDGAAPLQLNIGAGDSFHSNAKAPPAADN